MTTLVRQMPDAGHFGLPKTRSQNYAMWPSSRGSSPFNEPALQSSHCCDSIDTSPCAPISPPYSIGEFTLSPQKPRLYDEPAMPFLLEDFDNWINGWDDATDTTMFPLAEPLSPTVKLELLPPAIDAAELNIGPSICPSSPIDPATVSTMLDYSTVVSEDSVTDEHLLHSPSVQPKIISDPLRDGLYSTSLDWERPQFGPNSYLPISPTSSVEDLGSPALPAQPPPVCLASSPSPVPRDNSRKRKSPQSSDSDCPTPRRRKGSIPKKTAHNMIEKRYRTNLNDRIGALRDRIPSLRVTVKNSSPDEELHNTSQALSPPQRLSKGTVLSKAIEYINQLENRAKDLTKENRALKARVNAFEMLVATQCGPKSATPMASTCQKVS